MVTAVAGPDATTPAPGRSSRASAATMALARRAGAHLQAIGRRLSGSALTAAGLGCIDVGAFQAHPIAGWVVTGATVLVLDWKLDGSEQPGDRP